MKDKYCWALEDMFSSIDAWKKEFNEVKEDISLDEFKGKLGDKKSFLSCMQKDEKISRRIENLFVYAYMKKDENIKDSTNNELVAMAGNLATEFSLNSAFIVPELNSLDEKIIKDYIADKDLSNYDYMLKNLLRGKEHILSESEEKLLAGLGETFNSFSDVFSKLDNADLPLKPIRYNGKTFPLSHGTYSVYMRDKDREFRKKVFNKYYDTYIQFIDVISANYYGSVKKNVYGAKAKKFNSVHERALMSEDVNPIVYDNLISSVHKALPLLHDYMAYRKQQFSLKEMEMFDVYTPLVENAEIELEFDDAYDLVVKGLGVLGKEYQNLLIKGKEERWIDVYEKPNKRFGAYSIGTYESHPYVLLNYQKTTHDVFTIAHEMGHSLHTYFSNKNQCYNKAEYTIFVAEVASTVNEVLFAKYLIKNEKDKKLKKYLLSYLLELIRTTLYRQTQFAEFEYTTHKMIFEGKPLTRDNLCEIYGKLNEEYYGDAIKKGGKIKYEWARVPHFYSAFYVYKYATGIISALAIANRILSEGETAVKDYFKFLSSGGSNSPVELLKIAGVDLTKEQAFEGAFKVFSDTLNEIKQL